jgi:superfamily II DNA/RNA helicase
LTFRDLGIDQDIADALAAKGITEPFPIQEQAIPVALTGQDVIGQAKTGTGKTFGFGLPLIQILGPNPEPGAKALVVVPTRELCIQVAEDLKLACSNRPTMVAAIYGGKAYEGQVAEIDALLASEIVANGHAEYVTEQTETEQVTEEQTEVTE